MTDLRPPLRRVLALALLALAPGRAAAADSPAAPATGSIVGRVVLRHTSPDGKTIEIRGRDLSRVVVFLTPEGHAVPAVVPSEEPEIRQEGAQFQPDFLVVPVGQTVRFPNDDKIVHNVFSYSDAKRFDLGLYQKGEWREVTFTTPGAVQIFCSIHTEMYAVIYVAPNHLFTTSDAAGDFRMHDVPVGRYVLRTWNRRLPEGVESVEVTRVDVREGKPVEVVVELGHAEQAP